MARTDAATRIGKTSEEADIKQLGLAKIQGHAYREALREMAFNEADNADMRPVGDYLVAYAIEEAEGMYMLENGRLVWHNPTDENAHVEIAVADAIDGRFIPYLDVTAKLVDEGGEQVGEHRQPFIWHSWLYHYGRNWKIPRDGRYTLEVSIKAPDFPRHDKGNGNRYTEGTTVTFQDVRIETGQKKA